MTPTNTPELKPCPFCGSADVDPEGWLSENNAGERRTGPACDDCGASADSIEIWNRRAEGRPSPEGEELGPDDPTEGLPGKLMVIYGECSNGRPINGGDLEVIEDAAHALAALSTPSPEAGRGDQFARDRLIKEMEYSNSMRNMAAAFHAALLRIIQNFDMRSEIYTNDADLAEALAAFAREALTSVASPEAGREEGREWFWRIVDAEGLADLPSDEEAALRLLVSRASPPAPEPGYVAEPVAPWGYGWTYDSVGRAVVGKKVVTDTPEPTIFLSNVFAKGPIPLYASPVPVAISWEEIAFLADRIWSAMQSQEEDVRVNGAQHPGLLEPMRDILRDIHAEAQAILQRLSNQQGGDR